MKTQNGFTLVELAIVLMIIGLLIGGVLRGQEMMTNARVQSVIKQVNSYQAAYVSFMDAYGAEPGDNTMVLQRLAGCTSDNHCQPGNGDGIIGTRAVAYMGGQQAVTTENTQFWKHLALAHLISGVDPSALDPVWGKTHPSSALGGGFTVLSSTFINVHGAAADGLILRLNGSLTDNQGDIELNPVASPKQSAQIDRKMDDGLPSSGNVQAGATPINGMPEEDCEVAYNERNEQPFCLLSFIIN